MYLKANSMDENLNLLHPPHPALMWVQYCQDSDAALIIADIFGMRISS